MVGAVWLAILGKWSLLGIGIASMFLSAWALPVAFIPGRARRHPCNAVLRPPRLVLGFPFILVGSIYTIAVVGAWCLFVVLFSLDTAGSDAKLATLLWSYGVTLSPLSYMTNRGSNGPDGPAFGDMVVTFFTQIALVVMGVIVLVENFNPSALLWACTITMLVATVPYAVGIFLIMREASAAEAPLARSL
jgi:hypothetical protein